jgi:prepilin-type N-terminal cleavage/methylation domain-containing protein
MVCNITPPRTIQAFTLVELSIVLVILGLLIGGILSGKSLIRGAELRSVSKQYSQYFTAVSTFKDKYFALPGDMTNATQFWGARVVGMGCGWTASSDALTCNGTGDGRIDGAGGGLTWENFRFWQHLSNAGLIEGSYNGTTQRPVGKIANTSWAVLYSSLSAANPFTFDGQYENTFDFTSATGFASGEDLWNIDTKMDDGKPATGKLVVFSPTTLSACTDAVGTTAAQAATLTANYLLTSNSGTCNLKFRTQF